MLKKYLAVGAVLGLTLISLTGCTNKSTNEVTNTASTKKNTVANAVSSNSTTVENVEINYAENAKKQMAMPEIGEEIAIMHVKDFGDIKFKFFKDVAPKAVENFLTHSKNGYYNGLTFHRVIEEFMIQGGDPLGTGYGGESIWGKGFGKEVDKSLVPYRGSLCMAMSSAPNSIGSQFFITQANYNANMVPYFAAYKLPQALVEQYKIYGGEIISLYMNYTVFGQVIEGMDVVDKIAQTTKVSGNNGEVAKADQPIIESIEVTTYQGQ